MHNTSIEYKQVHNQTISWNDNRILIFICLVGRLLLEPLASSSSSFTTTSFLIQMLRWIRGSSSIESFIFLIAWAIFFGSWELDLQLLPPSLSLIMSWDSSCVHSSQILLKVINFLLQHNPQMNESHDLWRPFKVVIKISYYSSIASS